VLSESDLDLLEGIVGPDATDIWGGTQGMRMEAMRLVKETYTKALDRKIMESGSPYEASSFYKAREGMSAKDILAPLKPGLTRATREDIIDSREVPMSPSGSLSPFSSFLQGAGL
jgi:hypothetical protein